VKSEERRISFRCVGFFFCAWDFASGGKLDEVGAKVFADGRGEDLFLQETEVGEQLDEFFTGVVDVEILLKDTGRGDEHACGEVEIAGLTPEGDYLAAIGVFDV
jgi:hypothetical protein